MQTCAPISVARNLTLMQNLPAPKLLKWPFFFGDVLLLGVAYYISVSSRLPLALGAMGLLVLCVLAGAVVAVLPFILEYRLSARLAESNALTTAVEQMEDLEKLSAQISEATALWQKAHGEAEKVTSTASTISERMTAEARAFTEFMQRANDSEKATLKLEVDKLRRAESDWLQVLVRMMDHVYALNLGASRSGQPKLMEQLGHFQNACRDAARRVGLTPFAANPTEPFDAERHQVLDGNGKPPEGAAVAETVATGYTFQGRLLRPALVRLQGNGHVPVTAGDSTPPEASDHNQTDLPLQATGPSPG